MKLVPFTRVKQKKAGPSSIQTKVAKEMKAGGKGKEEAKTGRVQKGAMRTVYDAMFEQLPKRKGDGKGGDGNRPDDPAPA
jgi:hypothetical protein